VSIANLRNLFTTAKFIPEDHRQILASALKNYIETSPKDIADLVSIIDDDVVHVARALRSEDRATAMAFFNLDYVSTSSIWRGIERILPHKKLGGRIPGVIRNLSILLGIMMFAEDKAFDEEAAKDAAEEAAEAGKKQEKASAEAGAAFSSEMEAR
jgi:hypothetical protein